MQWLTTTQALESLRSSQDAPAWEQFCGHFRPVVVSFARQFGLSAADAEDAAQEAMTEFVKAFRGGKYDREKGRLSNWLFGVARRVILNFRGHRPQERLVADKTSGTSFWELIEDDRGIEQSWDIEWRRMVLKQCVEQARREFDRKVFEAFELYALSGLPVEQVAERLAMSRNAVYIAKSRVLSRLRELSSGFE